MLFVTIAALLSKLRVGTVSDSLLVLILEKSGSSENSKIGSSAASDSLLDPVYRGVNKKSLFLDALIILD
jgi:hypothetical protein